MRIDNSYINDVDCKYVCLLGRVILQNLKKYWVQEIFF